MWWIPAPDVPRTDYFVVMGANPQASQGSLLACPDMLGEIDSIRERGGKTVVIDPRRTGTADQADEWIPIVPGTDAAFLLAIVNVLFADGLVDLGDLADIVNGVDELPRAVRATSRPSRSPTTCGIPADTIRRIAHEIAAAPTAAVYGRIGLCNQEFGTLASWLIDVVNILTGNFDRPGGMMFGNPIAWSLALAARTPQYADGVEFGRWRSRVRGAPEVLGQVPVSCLAEEIATPGRRPDQGAHHDRGQPGRSARPTPAGSTPRSRMLECMISVDNYLNETTRHAHVILPGLSALEQPHYDDLIWSWAARSAGNWSPRRSSRRRPTARASGRSSPGSARWCTGMTNADIDVQAIDDGFFAALVQMQGPRRRAAVASPAATTTAGPSACSTCRSAPARSATATARTPTASRSQSFKDNPHGIDLGPMVPRVREILNTPSGKVELAPAYITADVPRLRARLERDDDGLVLDQPPAPAFEQLVDAQREGAREGQGPLHAADPSRRRGRARASPTARSRASAPRPARSRCRSR